MDMHTEVLLAGGASRSYEMLRNRTKYCFRILLSYYSFTFILGLKVAGQITI